MKRLLRVLFLCLLMFEVSQIYAQPALPNYGGGQHPSVAVKSKNNYASPAYIESLNDDPDGCYPDFAFMTYTDDTVIIDAGYHNYYEPYNPQWYYYVYNITTIGDTQYVNTPSNTFYTGSDSDLILSNFPPGVYMIRFGALVLSGYRNFDVRLTVVKKIRNVWLEVPTACANDAPTDNKFKFKIKTDPPLSDSLIFHVTMDKDGTFQPLPCNPLECYSIKQVCSVGTYPLNATVSRDGLHENFYGLDSLTYYSSKWPNSYPGGGDSVEDYYVKYQEDPFIGYGLTDLLLDTAQDYVDLFWSNGIDTFIRHIPIVVPGSTYHLDNYTVWGTQTWTPTSNPVVAMQGGGSVTDIYIKGDFIVENWAQLTLSNITLHFGPEGRMIIKNGIQGSDYGGYVYMANSKLTSASACGDNTKWLGVEVWGLATNQQATSPAPGFQGYLYMSGSTIENARTGVLLGRSDDRKNIYTGGVIRAMYSKFYDNYTAIKFNKYYYPSFTSPYIQPNHSLIQSCTFKRNSGMGSGYHDFIVEGGIASLNVNASLFEDIDQHRTMVGISSLNSGLKSIANTFKGLRLGVYSSGVTTSVMGLQVIGNTFENSLVGTVVTSLLAPQVVTSTFKVPAAPSLQTTVAYSGLVLSGSTGYEVRDNNFDTYTGVNQFNTGILVQSSGSTNNKINENSFDDLGVGVLSNYMNTNGDLDTFTTKGLQLLCNDIWNCKRYMAARGTDNTQHGVRITQGIPFVSMSSAGMVADNTVQYAGATIALYNPTNEVNELRYYWKNGAYKKPIGLYGSVILRKQDNAPGSCPGSLPPYVGPPVIAPPYEILAGLMQDSTGGMQLDTLTYYLEAIDDQYADLALADLQLNAGTIIRANKTYDDIAATYSMNTEEDEEFTVWGRKLMNLRIAMMADTLELTELDSNRVDTLELVAANAKMWARDRAQAWLTLYDGRTFENEMLYPDTSITVEPDSSDLDTSGGARYAHENTAPAPLNLKKNEANYLYPNPVHDVLNIVYRGSDAVLILTDVTGRMILQQELKAGDNKVRVEKLPAGIYLYRLTESGQDVMRGKILKD